MPALRRGGGRPARTELVHEGQEDHHAFILRKAGRAPTSCCPKAAGRVIEFSVPGDFMGLRSVLLRTSDHAFAAMSDIVVAEVWRGK